MLSIRVNGTDRSVEAKRGAQLLEILNAVWGVIADGKRERERAADAQTLTEAAQRGDTKTVRRLTRRLSK